MAAAQCITSPSESAPVDQVPVTTPPAASPPLPWGLLTIPNPGDFKPKTPESGPKSAAPNMPAAVLVEFAALYNASDFARQRRRWAAVTSHGCLIILNDIAESDRPADPRAFPPGTRLTMAVNKSSAALAAAENAARFEMAIVPREWTVALRPLASCVPPGALPEGAGDDVTA